MNNNLQGFTIIEALVAIALFGIMSVFLFSTFFSSFDLTNKSQQQLTTTSQAQNIMETVRSAWSVPGGTGSSNYDYACVPNFPLPAGYTVQFWNLSSRAQYVSSTNVAQAAAAPASNVKFPSTAATTSKPATNPACSAASGNTVTPAGGTAQSPAMRRVTVSSTDSSDQGITLTLDILDPQ